MKGVFHSTRFFRGAILSVGLAAFADAGADAGADEKAFEEIEPILWARCYDCHGDGMDKGDFAMDDYESVAAHLGNFDVWYEIWKNVRSNLMPPADKEQPSAEEREKLLAFIETHVFRIDHDNPDPGRVTIRRLNREEYRYTVKDILGVDLPVEDILPADDTGYGFDTIGDVLSISPLLMEKYLEAAGMVVEEAVPTDGPAIVEWTLDRKAFKDARSDDWSLDWMPFEAARTMESQPWVSHDGEYEVLVGFQIRGSEEASSHTATIKLGVDDKALAERKVGWDNSKSITLKGKTRLSKGRDHTFRIATEPGEPPGEGEKKLAVKVDTIRIRGPLDGSRKDYPWHVRHLFSEGPPSADENKRDSYRKTILEEVATRAFRRPATELLTANYTFLNESLAEWYGVDGVEGSDLRKVDLPEDSRRGGLLNQATFHIVTSNPTRTSPVKRGLFVLENFLATPPPPAAPDVPPLEESQKGGNKDLPLREVLKIHAEQKLCASCHARMDPIGLALENYDPVGLWRDEEKGHPIETAGKLPTGEAFSDARELGNVLANQRRGDFHRALAEKLLTYAAGRGIEYFDAPTIDQMVADLESDGATLRRLVYGVVESAPFQKRRGEGDHLAAPAD
ncbi:MAG: DUF1588 domain-containing protein [Verrucomicrobiales bacterium]